MQNYTHLKPEERAMIMVETQRGTSIRAISRILNRAPSSISRELNRNRYNNLTYCAINAANNYCDRRKYCVKPLKLIEGNPLYLKIHDWLLCRQWSPMQISGALKRLYGDNPGMQVSHETIYASIYAHPKGELKKYMIRSLRRSKKKRGMRGSTSIFNSLKIEDHQLIHHRPEQINERQLPGHWEGDLIVGAMNRSCVGTLVDRKTGYLVLSKMDSKSAADVRKGFERQMKVLPSFLRLSMTYDRGAEMAQHPVMSKNLKMNIYFADPHSPWQRGSSENINGLIRQYLPKGEDLSLYSQAALNDIAWLLNTRPRQRFDFRTPQELMEQILANHINSVALDS